MPKQHRSSSFVLRVACIQQRLGIPHPTPPATATYARTPPHSTRYCYAPHPLPLLLRMHAPHPIRYCYVCTQSFRRGKEDRSTAKYVGARRAGVPWRSSMCVKGFRGWPASTSMNACAPASVSAAAAPRCKRAASVRNELKLRAMAGPKQDQRLCSRSATQGKHGRTGPRRHAIMRAGVRRRPCRCRALASVVPAGHSKTDHVQV